MQGSGLLPHCRLDNGENTEVLSILGEITKSHLPTFQAEAPLTPMDCVVLYFLNLTGMKNMPVLFLRETVTLNLTLTPSAFQWRKRKAPTK